MDAALVLQARIGPLALDAEDDFLETTDPGHVGTEGFGGPAVVLSVSGIHAVQIGGKQPGLVAPGPSPDLHDDVLLVLGVPGQKHEPQLLI